MSLASVDFLARVVAAGAGPHGIADGIAQRVVDPVGGALRVPPLEVPVHGVPRREVVRQLPPRASRAIHVQDRLNDPPAWVDRRAAATAQWHHRLNQRPLLIGQIRGMRAGEEDRTPHRDHTSRTSHGGTPNAFPTRSNSWRPPMSGERTSIKSANCGGGARTVRLCPETRKSEPRGTALCIRRSPWAQRQRWHPPPSCWLPEARTQPRRPPSGNWTSPSGPPWCTARPTA